MGGTGPAVSDEEAMHLVTNGLSNAPAQPLRGHVCESLKLTTTKRPRKGWAGALRRPLVTGWRTHA